MHRQCLLSSGHGGYCVDSMCNEVSTVVGGPCRSCAAAADLHKKCNMSEVEQKDTWSGAFRARLAVILSWGFRLELGLGLGGQVKAVDEVLLCWPLRPSACKPWVARRPGVERNSRPGVERVARPGGGRSPRPGVEGIARPGEGRSPRPGVEGIARPGGGRSPRPGVEGVARPGEGQSPKPGGGRNPRPGEGEKPGGEERDSDLPMFFCN